MPGPGIRFDQGSIMFDSNTGYWLGYSNGQYYVTQYDPASGQYVSIGTGVSDPTPQNLQNSVGSSTAPPAPAPAPTPTAPTKTTSPPPSTTRPGDNSPQAQWDLAFSSWVNGGMQGPPPNPPSGVVVSSSQQTTITQWNQKHPAPTPAPAPTPSAPAPKPYQPGDPYPTYTGAIPTGQTLGKYGYDLATGKPLWLTPQGTLTTNLDEAGLSNFAPQGTNYSDPSYGMSAPRDTITAENQLLRDKLGTGNAQQADLLGQQNTYIRNALAAGQGTGEAMQNFMKARRMGGPGPTLFVGGPYTDPSLGKIPLGPVQPNPPLAPAPGPVGTPTIF